MDGVGKGGGRKQSGNFEWMTKRLFSISFHQERYISDLMAISRTACSQMHYDKQISKVKYYADYKFTAKDSMV